MECSFRTVTEKKKCVGVSHEEDRNTAGQAIGDYRG